MIYTVLNAHQSNCTCVANNNPHPGCLNIAGNFTSQIIVPNNNTPNNPCVCSKRNSSCNRNPISRNGLSVSERALVNELQRLQCEIHELKKQNENLISNKLQTCKQLEHLKNQSKRLENIIHSLRLQNQSLRSHAQVDIDDMDTCYC